MCKFLIDYPMFSQPKCVVMFLQSELENLSFMYTKAEDYAQVKRRIADLYKEHEKELVEVIRFSFFYLFIYLCFIYIFFG